MKTQLHRRALLLAAPCMTFGLAGAWAQAPWPQRPVTIVVPTPAGGPADVVARIVAQKLQDRLGQAVLVDNKPGAGGLLGVELVARARPDGYTIAMPSSSVILSTAIDPKAVRFDIRTDFELLTTAGKIPLVMSANNAMPFSNFREFVSYAKANPGKLSVGVTPGLATTAHVLMERIKLEMGIDIVPVAYKGSGPATIAVSTGEVQVIMDNISGSGAFIQAGKIKPIAIMTPQRNPNYPQVLSIAEQGHPGLAVETWNGFVVPKGVPKEVVQLLQRELMAVMNDPEMVAKLRSLGQDPGGQTPEEFAAIMRNGLEMWTRVIRQANLKLTQ
ncbi:Bug family tripartite tricarboxylate transporter substrate binding protein [Hydrogenophaga sp. BPS33]|uniref:Bug family tripartite tricarboxylate transporter substrate binding protein n=1 Tax=Hydrogenophaga sp. BPS33 TaxID=2651974 RepID=UPI00132031A8|nr:tripartite tricarboxylate transporter substrate binding protein [Hydrogenophaga sp. BPS33]QHE85515.1 tripartite tricarboxylate transporter substrate binding protein [Hydrogenophaga sp. BPS33]